MDDNQALTVNAHTLKGITSYYTKAGVYRTCLELEAIGRSESLPEDKDEAFQTARKLQKQVMMLTDSMQEFIKKH
jgi:hypothetical protein